ncbi:hypothetical protein [Streptomyces ehimensis]|uniref:DUF7848 domain-containing protein n=1 Tax=Streptomyces ehimensis TaxID=68195 RepID=A0ABV9BP74_9ACTN
MTARTVFLFGTWTLAPDQEPDAEPISYAMQCAVCGSSSDTSEDAAVGQRWTFQHVGRHPSHHTFRETITRPWRTWMQP